VQDTEGVDNCLVGEVGAVHMNGVERSAGPEANVRIS
jgi:hypothetical protein